MFAVAFTLAACGSSLSSPTSRASCPSPARKAAPVWSTSPRRSGSTSARGHSGGTRRPMSSPCRALGVCWLDYDGDGALDLFAVNSYAVVEAARWRREGGLPETALYRNEGDRFEDVSEDAGANFAIRGYGLCRRRSRRGRRHRSLRHDRHRAAAAVERRRRPLHGGSPRRRRGCVRLARRRCGGRRERRRPSDLVVAGYADPLNPVPDAARWVSGDGARCPRPAAPEQRRRGPSARSAPKPGSRS